MRNNKKQYTFIENTAILMIATILVKILGMAFKIPLASLLGGEGMGYFMSAYSIFGPISSVALSGISVSIAKIVAEFESFPQSNNSRKIITKAILLYGTIGFFCSFWIFNNATIITKFIGNENAYLSVKFISFAIFFCFISAVIRGYFEGKKNMFPTAISQVIESFVRLVMGSLFGFLAIKYAIAKYEETSLILSLGSAGAVFGVSISAFAGTIFVVIRYFFDKPTKYIHKIDDNTYSMQILLKEAFPICACVLIGNLASIIDLTTVINRLNYAINLNEGYFLFRYSKLFEGTFNLSNLPNFLYGSYTGMALTIFNIIPAISATIGTSALPTIAFSQKTEKIDVLKNKITAILKFTAIIAMPISIGIILTGKPILMILFPFKKQEVIIAAKLLSILGIGGISTAIIIPLNSIHQAIGNSSQTLKLIMLGSIVKLLFNYILIGIPQINILGVAISSVISQTLILILSVFSLNKKIDIKSDLYDIFIKPLMCVIITAIISSYTKNYIFPQDENIITICCFTLIFAVIYIIFLVISHTISKDKKFYKFLFKKTDKNT